MLDQFVTTDDKNRIVKLFMYEKKSTKRHIVYRGFNQNIL